MALEIEFGSEGNISFTFSSREQRVLSSLLLLGMHSAPGFEDQLGSELAASIRSGLDPSTGAGSISGSPKQLTMALRLIDLLADNISLTVSEDNLRPSSDDYGFYSLFEDLPSQVRAGNSAELAIRDALSNEQLSIISSEIREYDSKLPFMFRSAEEFEFF